MYFHCIKRDVDNIEEKKLWLVGFKENREKEPTKVSSLQYNCIYCINLDTLELDFLAKKQFHLSHPIFLTDVVVCEGGDVHVTMQVQGVPTPAVQVIYDNILLRTLPVDKEDGLCELTLLDCGQQLSGEYVFEAVNEAGKYENHVFCFIYDGTILRIDEENLQRLHSNFSYFNFLRFYFKPW